MKTRITLKDVVTWNPDNDLYNVWEHFCRQCQYNHGLTETGWESRCIDCKVRMAPPTRWRKAKK